MNLPEPREELRMSTPSGASLSARILRTFTAVEAVEVRAVLLSMLYFLFLLGSYSIVKPVRDSMGTVYGMDRLQELFTATFFASFVFSPLYAWLASRMRLSTFLPWVYGFIALTILAFGAVYMAGSSGEPWIAASFYVWVSTFNLLIISVFWSFMADIFSREQAKRLFGCIAAGGTIGAIVGPAIAKYFSRIVGNGGLMLIAAGGFVVTAVLVVILAREKERLKARGAEAQHTSLEHRLGGNPLEGFALILRSRYLLLLALFLLLMTSVSTIVYFQLGDLITKAYPDKDARTAVYASIDLYVNSLSVVVQLFGTGHIIKRFGAQTGLLLNPVIMVIAFLAVAFSPVLLILGGIQIVRRVAEYAVARPTREMLFTVVGQESKYKAKNVIDTVVYRFGDVSASWLSHAVQPHGVAGLAIVGAITSAVWFPIAYLLGKRYESVRSGELVDSAGQKSGAGPGGQPQPSGHG